MLLRHALLFVILVITTGVSAQFEAVADTVVCYEYTIPTPQGTGLSSDIVISSEPQGGGIRYSVGDVVTASTSIFYYDAVNGFDDCYSVFVITSTPLFSNNNDTILVCDVGVLPIPNGNNFTSDLYYSTSPDGSGRRLYPGNVLDSSMQLYLFDGAGSCSATDTSYLLIGSSPILLPYIDTVIACGFYIIPEARAALYDTYDIVDTEGILYSVGDTLRSATTLITSVTSDNCTSSYTQHISFYDYEPLLLRDTILCPGQELNTSHYADSRDYNARLYQNGSTLIGSSQFVANLEEGLYELCFREKRGNCDEEYCMEVEMLDGSSWSQHQSLAGDTVKVCRREAIFFDNISDFVSNLSLQADSIYIGSLYMPNEFFLGSITDPGYYDIHYLRNRAAACGGTDSLSFVLNIVEDCSSADTVMSKFCGGIGYYEVIRAGGSAGGRLYSTDGDRIDKNQYGDYGLGQDSIEFLLIYDTYRDPVDDTVRITVVASTAREIIDLPAPLDDVIRLCYGESFVLAYFQDAAINQIIWSADVYLVSGVDTIWIGNEGFSSFSNTVAYGYSSSNGRAYHLEEPSSDYMIVIDSMSLLASSTEGVLCVTNAMDTIIVKTLVNTSRVISDILCYGDSLKVGQEYYSIDNPSDTIILSGAAANGCDSIVFVDLDFLPPASNVISRSFCDTSRYIIVDCQRYDFGYPYEEIVLPQASVLGCDSMIIVDLQYEVATTMTDTLWLCPDATISLGGIDYRAGDSVTDTISSLVGCDSLYQITVLQETTVVSSTTDTTICAGTALEWLDRLYDSPGLYRDTILDSRGCDSIYQELRLEVSSSPATTALDTTICRGSSLVWAGNVVSAAGLYRDTVRAVMTGCDSLYHELVLTISPAPTSAVWDTMICPGDTMLIDQVPITTDTLLEVLMRDIRGCDSISVLYSIMVAPAPEYSLDIDGDLCDGPVTLIIEPSTYITDWSVSDPSTVASPGTYLVTITDIDGCAAIDSLVVDPAQAPAISGLLNHTVVGQDTTVTPQLDYVNVASISWSDLENLSCTDCPEPVITTDTDLTVPLRLQSSTGCILDTFLTINFILDTTEISVGSDLILPNIFNPTSTILRNQRFGLLHPAISDYDMRIYDRWGSPVYLGDALSAQDITAGWDGQSNGQVATPGVYVYAISARANDGSVIKLVGSVTLMQ